MTATNLPIRRRQKSNISLPLFGHNQFQIVPRCSTLHQHTSNIPASTTLATHGCPSRATTQPTTPPLPAPQPAPPQHCRIPPPQPPSSPPPLHHARPSSAVPPRRTADADTPRHSTRLPSSAAASKSTPHIDVAEPRHSDDAAAAKM